MNPLIVRVPDCRIRGCNLLPRNTDGEFVLYWMTAFRRSRWNFALQRAVELASDLNKPLLVLEPLRCGYPYASDRLHAFVLRGMEDNRAAFASAGVAYYPYVEREPGEGQGLLACLAEAACCIVADDSPAFFLPRMLEAAAGKVRVAMEAVDSNGLLPVREAQRPFATAHAFRRFLQKTLGAHLLAFPAEDPLAGVPRLPPAEAPGSVLRRWPAAPDALLREETGALAGIRIDHRVGAVETPGGETAGRKSLRAFVSERLQRYAEDRNKPELEATSGLSPYLHFGHISAHEAFSAVARSEGWSLDHTARRASGSRTGWWGMGAPAEAFLDQLVTWRELGYNAALHLHEYRAYATLPEWAMRTLHKHSGDARPHLYTRAELEQAETHDALWNAAQRQLVREGRLHNYLRMLWGKKILEWSPSPREALETMLHLNDAYALDGRDPNSVSGIFWCLGRYDRPWGPERPIFGTVRYMSSENTARKVRVAEYLNRYAQ